MMKYINSISQERQTVPDRQHVFEVFEEHSTKSEGQEKGIGHLDYKNAQLAQEQIFEDWDVDLTGPQE